MGALPDFNHLQCSRYVHGHWLFEINVLASRNHGLQVPGMIIGRRSDYDRVQFFGGRDLLVSVGTNKELRRVNS